jgi:signal transduction histidine kinase
MTLETSHAAGGQDPWSRELHVLLTRLFRVRMAIVPALALVAVLFFVFDRVAWKLALIVAIMVAATVGVAVEYRRIQRQRPSPRTIALNLVGMFLLQTGLIYVTGGIESPVLMVFGGLGLVVGVSLGDTRRTLAVVGLPMGATMFLAASVPLGWLPRATPAIYGIGDGYWASPVYVGFKVLVTCLLLFITSSIGATIRQSFDRTIERMRDARRETLEAMSSRNQELTSVAATVAHELKNPLTSIQGLAQLMAKGTTPGTKEHERLEVMRREIARMVNVLDEFRNFSRPLSGLSLKPTPLLTVLEEVVGLGEGSAGPGPVDWSVTGDAAVTVVCDPRKVKQALLNLVQNSLEAMGGTGRVGVGLRVEGGRALVVIQDSGPGLAEAVADRLFTPGVTTKDQGTGIGLVVARSVAEQHGGSLTMRNLAAGGCEAVLSLPLAGPGPREEPT